MKSTLEFFILLATILTLGSCQKDDTLVERSKGKDVSEATIRKIQRTGIFTDDQDFLRRLAYFETQFGENATTYREGYYGGIWQVDEAYFNQTKNNVTLPTFHDGIRDFFGITWANVTWNDLLKPLHSALAARLYFVQLNKPIPGSISDQANFWRENYRNNGSTQDFIDKIRELERVPECQGRMDLCIVLDGSGSIGAPGFENAKGFVAKLIESLPLEVNRIGLVLYSNNADTVFPIDSNLTLANRNTTVWNMRYPNANTYTAAGLTRAVELFNSTYVRPGIPRVIATLTDGESTDPNQLPQAVAAIKNASLVSFAVGIGNALSSPVGQRELLQIALNEPSNVLLVTSGYDSLSEFLYRLNSITCEVPQDPEVGTNQTDSLTEGQRRFFKFVIPLVGITIRLEESAGKVTGYFSYTYETPNSAIYDGIIDGVTFIPSRGSRQGAEEVYITVQGTDPTTNYTISTVEGNQVPTTITTDTTTDTTTTITTTTDTTTTTQQNSGTSLVASFVLVFSIIMSNFLY